MKNLILTALAQNSRKTGDICTVALVWNRNLYLSKTSSALQIWNWKKNVQLQLINTNKLKWEL